MYKLTIYLFLIVFLYSCDDLSGHLGVSKNIADSKDRGVFIAEYKSFSNPLKINDSLKLNVVKVWLEKKWRYEENLQRATTTDGYQMILESHEEDLRGYSTRWTIGIDFVKVWRYCSNNSIMTDFKDMPSDTIIWKVQEGAFLDSASRKKIIGELILLRKY